MRYTFLKSSEKKYLVLIIMPVWLDSTLTLKKKNYYFLLYMSRKIQSQTINPVTCYKNQGSDIPAYNIFYIMMHNIFKIYFI